MAEGAFHLSNRKFNICLPFDIKITKEFIFLDTLDVISCIIL